MTSKRLTAVLATILSLFVAAIVLVGCGGQQAREEAAEQAPAEESVERAGSFILRVNPEFRITYDDAGKVTAVEALNDDAKSLGISEEDYLGMECRAAVSALVTRIHEGGFLVDPATGQGRTIQLEVEADSALPADDFLRNIVHDTETYVVGQQVVAPMEVSGSSNYGWTDYADTDYGPGNDGVSDYYDTDYGPLNDGATDYADTDYGPGNDGATDYGQSASSGGNSGGGAASSGGGAASSGGGSSSGGGGGGGNSGYGNSGYGGGGNSGYGNSSYGGGGDSGYDGGSGYGDSGYDD